MSGLTVKWMIWWIGRWIIGYTSGLTGGYMSRLMFG